MHTCGTHTQPLPGPLPPLVSPRWRRRVEEEDGAGFPPPSPHSCLTPCLPASLPPPFSPLPPLPCCWTGRQEKGKGACVRLRTQDLAHARRSLCVLSLCPLPLPIRATRHGLPHATRHTPHTTVPLLPFPSLALSPPGDPFVCVCVRVLVFGEAAPHPNVVQTCFTDMQLLCP